MVRRLSEPLVSVVTPVFNGELYLEECIESVLAQTYQNWEYVIFDNRSTDRTAEIARAFASRDPRIRHVVGHDFVPHIENWNRSMTEISPGADYVKVVHADDFLFPECLERMVALADRHPNVGLVGAYLLCGAEVELDVLPYSVEVMPGAEACRHSLAGGKHIFGTPTSTMIRADLVRKRDGSFYNPSYVHADTAVCYEVLHESDYGFVHQVLTYTRNHDASVTAWTTRVGSWLPDHIEMLVSYGPTYLAPDVYRRRFLELERRYYVVLLKHALRLRLWRDPSVRTFQQRALERLLPELDAQGLPGRNVGHAFGLLTGARSRS